jgi:alpha-N-arabinofuranosidase
MKFPTKRLPLPWTLSALLLSAVSLLAADAPTPLLTLDLAKPGVKLSPVFYGLMTEEINHAYDGGLYAELIQNRIFKDNAQTPVGWSLVGGAESSIALDQTQPINEALTVCLKLQAAGGKPAGIANEGFWGVPVKPVTTYRASFYAKTSGKAGAPLTVSLQSADGATIYAQATVPKISAQWQRYAVRLTTGKDVTPAANARFVITTAAPGTYWFNLVSLFPPTWNDRPNGNRVDLMQWLVDLKPAFLRCPGGNYLEGNTIDTRFPWKKTLGDLAQRPGHMGTWGYRSSDGLGLLEFMEWAEDMHAKPVLAVYAGYSLPTPENKNKGTHVAPGKDLEPFVQEALEEIEYVSGAVTTKWGAQRARDGHPAPFPLHYVEIGNEDGFDRSGSYAGRFDQFYDAIKARYPQLELIATAGGSDGLGHRVKLGARHPDVIDEHYYQTSGEMMKLAHKYDRMSRKRPKIFVGEWATREVAQTAPDGKITYVRMPWTYKDQPTPALHAALGDAAFMTGLERNADLIVMNCYAPLLVNVNPGALQWSPDLLGYNSLQSFASPSYYAQWMFNRHRGDTTIPATTANEPETLFTSATHDAATGMIYLKVVNMAETPQPVQIALQGAAEAAASGQSIVLTSASAQDANSLAEPKKVVPVTAPAEDLGKAFTRTFAPHSITVLEWKAK